VLAPPVTLGVRMGELTLAACRGKNPCRIVYLYGFKGLPGDEGTHDGFHSVIVSNPNIQIVDTGEAKYNPTVALSAMQDIMQRTPNFEVVVGTDQAIEGAQLALQQAGKLSNVALVSIGGSTTAFKQIAAGNWYASVMDAPKTEGTLVMTKLLDLLQKGTLKGPRGIDPLSTLPAGGLVTKATLSKLKPQWNG
jgi:ribose transport system substrate-binding protein